jgi:hypothetical protein
MISLYATVITPRLEYIVRFLETEMFGEKIHLESSQELFLKAAGFKINYSPYLFDDVFRIHPAGILHEKEIKEQFIQLFEYQKKKAFFATGGDYPFDIFSAIFYLLSRYEEYLPFEADSLGRFPHEASLAYKGGFLHEPLINLWLNDFKNYLHEHYGYQHFRVRKFNCLLTYDIDIAFAYTNKPWWQVLGGGLKDVYHRRWNLVKERWNVAVNRQHDPYNVYEWLDAMHLYCRMPAYFFFLVAKKKKGLDRNISTKNRNFQYLIEYYSKHHRVGLHPSIQAGRSYFHLKAEKEWLEVYTEKETIHTRQHYLQLQFPKTYRRLIEVGLQKDFTMGYSNINGFRASVCSSFNWYDLQEEKITDLLVYPFCFMDAASFYHLKQTPQQAYHELVKYYDTIKRLNGLMISTWHNTILSNGAMYAGWRDMYEIFMKDTVYWDAYSGS